MSRVPCRIHTKRIIGSIRVSNHTVALSAAWLSGAALAFKAISASVFGGDKSILSHTACVCVRSRGFRFVKIPLHADPGSKKTSQLLETIRIRRIQESTVGQESFRLVSISADTPLRIRTNTRNSFAFSFFTLTSGLDSVQVYVLVYTPQI